MFKKITSTLMLASMILLSSCQLNTEAEITNAQSTSLSQTTIGEDVLEKTDTKEISTDPTNTKTEMGEEPATTTSGDSVTLEGNSADEEADSPLADSELTLIASGDVLSHITNTQAAKKADGSYDFWPQMAEIEGLLSDGDYTLVNLESPIAGEKFGYRGFPKFNAPVNLGFTLKKLGVDLAITSNNHAMDNGFEGLKQNLDNLDRIGLEHTGTYRTQEEADEVFVKEINGIKIGFIATSYGTNNIPVPNDFAVDLNSKKLIRKKIAQAREEGAEIIVHHIHWGREYTEYPSQYQMDYYGIMTEEGVDVIVGSHPHRLQPMEMRKITHEGRTKNQAVIWSTGNMWQGQKKKRDFVNLGSVFRIEIERKDGVAQVKDLDYDLIYNLRWKVDGKEQYKVIPHSDMDLYKEQFPNTYDTMKKEFEWGEKTLNNTVDVIYSDGTRPKQP